MEAASRVDWAAWLYYDETSPSFLRWKVDVHCGRGRVRMSAHSVAGTLSTSTGYYYVTARGVRQPVHRIVLRLHGESLTRKDHVDHKDGVRTNNSPSNLRKVTAKLNQRNAKMPRSNTSTVVGVNKTTKRPGYDYWVAEWLDLGGTKRKKAFSIKRLGDEAFRLACEHRAKMMEQLNAAGAGYTERHGT